MNSRQQVFSIRPVLIGIGLVIFGLGIFAAVKGLSGFGRILQKPLRSVLPATGAASTLEAQAVAQSLAAVSPGQIRWEPAGLPGETVTDLAVVGSRLIAATYGSQHGIFRSEDGGESWEAINTGLAARDVEYLKTAPEDGTLIYALAQNQVWRTTDGGEQWTALRAPDPVFAVASADGNTLYSADLYIEFWKSPDRGTTWQLVNRDFGWCNQIYASPVDPDTVYCLTVPVHGSRLMVSRNGGEDWNPTGRLAGGRTVFKLAPDPSQAAGAYACMESAGVYRTANRGKSWTPVSDEIPKTGSRLSCRDIWVDPGQPDRVIAAFDALGIWLTQDGGGTWEALSGGWDESITPLSLAVAPGSQAYLFAGTYQNGVWRARLP